MSKLITELKNSEAKQVLDALIKKHPELKKDADEIIRGLLSDISLEKTAAEVTASLHAIDDIDELNNRAGSHRYGYVEPSQAACEMCEEVIDPFIDDMTRRIRAGDYHGAFILCQGIALGLYNVKKVEGAVLEWAGDTIEEEAGRTIDTFYEEMKKQKSAKVTAEMRFSEDFLKKNIPNWADWIDKIFSEQQKK